MLAFVRELRGRARSWSSPTCRASCSTSSSTCRASTAWCPVEMFGRTEFPRVGDRPLFLTLGPHAFFWFSLEADPSGRGVEIRPIEREGTDHQRSGGYRATPRGRRAGPLSARAAGLHARADAGSARRRGASRRVALREVVRRAVRRRRRVPGALAIFDVEYTEGEAEAYVLPLALAPRRRRGSHRRTRRPQAIVGVRRAGGAGRSAMDALRRAARARIPRPRCSTRSARGAASRVAAGEVTAHSDARRTQSLRGGRTSKLEAERRSRRAEQHVGHFRRAADPEAVPPPRARREPGHRDRRRADRRAASSTSPAVGGWLAYRTARGEPAALGVLQAIRRQRGRRVGVHARRGRRVLRARRGHGSAGRR